MPSLQYQGNLPSGSDVVDQEVLQVRGEVVPDLSFSRDPDEFENEEQVTFEKEECYGESMLQHPSSLPLNQGHSLV